MAKTVVGLFDTMNEAQSVVQDLVDSGFPREDISLVAADERERAVGESQAGEGAGVGAGIGAVGGGVLGLLVGLGALAIPGIGPVIAAGPLAAAIGTATAGAAGAAIGAAGGAVAGGLIGGLIGAGVPEEHAGMYAEGVRRGGTLVMVNSTDDMSSTAQSIMQRHGAVDIDDRSAEWRQSGWSGFDPEGSPYRGRGEGDLGREWQESSKAGTAGGAVAGAATGAAAGAVGGPVGAVIGGVAGAAAGAGVGAAGDVAGEKVEDSAQGGSSGRGAGWTDVDERDQGLRGTARSDLTADQTLTEAEEQLKVGKRQVETGGARVTRRVEERPVEEQVNLRDENVHVERRPADRPLTNADEAFRETSFEVRERHEEPVVSKEARVTGEVVVDKDVTEHTETIRDTVRRSEVDIDQTGGRTTGQMAGDVGTSAFDTFDNDFRTHYQQYGTNSGYTYDQYSNVYRYGYNLARDDYYRGRSWDEIEPDVRRRWEERNPNTWDRFKDSVRYAWERVSGRH